MPKPLGTFTLILYRMEYGYFSKLLPNTKIIKDAILLEFNTVELIFVFDEDTTIDIK